MFPFGFLAFVDVVVGFAEDRREGFGQCRAELLVVGDVEARVEGLARQSPVGVTGVGVGAMRVGEQAKAVVEKCAATGVVLAVLGKSVVDVGEAGADSVLVSLQGAEVDGVGEVCGEELVALGFEACPVRGQVRDLLILARVALVERCINVSSEALVSGVADREGGVGVRDEAFGDGDGYGSPRAGGFLRGAAGADEVGVGRAARVGGEVEQHAGAAGATVQESFEVVRVLDVACHFRRPRFQQ